MQGKGTVKNPLTVIAIFAGTAEISGTAILPLLEAGAQSTYIWFLMLFPFTLIALFFITLNWNHKVLYAPSDFKDEDHFVNILQKASLKDQIEELGEEVAVDSEEVIESEDSGSDITKASNQQANMPGNSQASQHGRIQPQIRYRRRPAEHQQRPGCVPQFHRDGSGHQAQLSGNH